MDINKIFHLIPKSVFDELPHVIERFTINNPLRLSHFLAQTAHESGNFAYKVESLSYSKEGLLKTFPKYFTETTAIQYQRKSEMIANRVYANRMGNGDERSGDGWKFRGRGYIQLTGENTYKEFQNVISDNILENPNLVSEKYPLFSAGWFWDKNKINEKADKGYESTNVLEITRIVNGGNNGFADRLEKFNTFYNILKL